MEKINVMPVVLDKKFLKNTINSLDIDNVNFETILVDSDEKSFKFADKKIPLSPFATVHELASKCKDFIWLISGCDNDSDAVKMKKFLMTLDISEDNIVNFGVSSWVSPIWVANLRYIEKRGADFFATGNEYMRDGLNLNFIPRADSDKNLGGVNLSDTYQDLRQSYLTAKYVFEHVEPGTIKFVLIGLTPDSFCFDEAEDFFGFQHFLSLAKSVAAQPDLNFDNIKNDTAQEFSAKAILDWEDEAKALPTDSVKANIQILKDYIELCLANGAKPIGVVFPFAPAVRKIYDEKLLANFRKTIRRLEESYYFKCIDMFDLDLKYYSFSDMTHLNLRGNEFANAKLSLQLLKENLVPLENFCDMTYEYFDKLSYLMPKDEYNALIDSVFNISAQNLRYKKKIKIAFALYDTSMWCGDELYNFFAENERFEPTIFLYKIPAAEKHEFIRDDFSIGLEQLKSRGLNVVAVEDADMQIPPQDVIIFLTPYAVELPNALQLSNLTLKTLVTYISYAFSISRRGAMYHNRRIFHTAWKLFQTSNIALEDYDKKSSVGMTRGFSCGCPKTDIFFKKDAEFKFDWKMVSPNAKKIIWAPNHSIPKKGLQYATFQWNYQFMYEFAKAHPETSWVVKPHPALAFRAVDAKIFPTDKAYKEYIQKWNDLPNAQVYTGAYYQDIFATSDGMIHDSCSFIAEYQFVNKPMIFLTREGEKFNKLGREILKGVYLVDGQDLDGIAALIQNVFIEGKDTKAPARKKIFDRYLNYPAFNGMSASEFIYISIADELKEIPKEEESNDAPNDEPLEVNNDELVEITNDEPLEVTDDESIEVANDESREVTNDESEEVTKNEPEEFSK